MERTGVIIVAGGSGSRAGGARPKQFRFLDGMPVLARTINTFAAALPGAEIVATAVLTGVEGRKLTFNVGARDAEGMIGEGIHIRYAVDRRRFMEKVGK